MRRLRTECPWDAEQTHQSILPNLVEEAYELYDALEAVGEGVPGEGVEPDWGAYADVEEELGDVLLQVLFHTTMGEEIGGVSLEGVVSELRLKLIRRHPHVFGDVEAGTAQDTLERWEKIKIEEKGRESALDGVPRSLPSVPRAEKLQKRAARVGFDWDEIGPVLGKVHEELGELEEAMGTPHAEHELGDLLFSVVNLARHLDLDPELAARRAVDRFEQRFRQVEVLADRSLGEMTLEEMDVLWEKAKEANTP
jgi:MazG family protein